MAQLYSNLKFLRFQEPLSAMMRGEIAAPVHIRIKPINRCNHHCWYCAYRADNLQLGEAMDEHDRIPPDKMFEIVDDIIAMGVKAVTFSGGGEPLLYRELPGVMGRLAAGGVRLAALTNGANLKHAMADAFAAHASWIRVSLDAWDDTSYTRSRGAPEGAFTRLIENMQDFAARDSRCVLGVSFVVGEGNHSHIAKVCALLKDVGVNHVKVSGAVVSNKVEENNAYHAPLRQAVAAQIHEAKSLADDSFSIIDHYHELEERFEKRYQTCAFMRFLTVIGADCQVYACQDKAYTAAGRLGSIADRRFRDFWFSDENRASLQRLDPSDLCRHHCVAHQKNLVLQEILTTDPEHACFV